MRFAVIFRSNGSSSPQRSPAGRGDLFRLSKSRKWKRFQTGTSRGRIARGQEFIDFGHDREGVGDVEDIGFAARPAAVGVRVDCAAFGDEAPADGVGFFAMATGGKSFRMPRGGAGLANLVEVG